MNDQPILDCLETSISAEAEMAKYNNWYIRISGPAGQAYQIAAR
jgi:hypothetical protein